ncbi:MAG: biotin/lipoate A/B protein ligase family protein [Gemmataceae bacterium]
MIRLLPSASTDGPHNMAADEVLLESAIAGLASFRFYQWNPATLSLGYFQAEQTRHQESSLADLPYVRRASGGATLVHHHEITYALALPPGQAWQRGESWLRRMHLVIGDALAEFGIVTRLYEPGNGPPFRGRLCFHHFTAGDLMIGSSKIVGSAQRKQRGGLMQHGGILLARTPHAPSLPGIVELTGRSLSAPEVGAAIRRAFVRATGWEVTEADWSPTERNRIEELANNKYSQESWNCKR